MDRSRLLTAIKSSKFLPIVCILLLAFAVRLAYLCEIHDNPFFRHMMIDEDAYDRWAQHIASGNWLGNEIFYQDPLYPYFLGIIYSLIGRSFLWVRFIQLLIGCGTCVLLYYLGSLLFDRPTGFLAGLIAAFYRPFFYFEAMFLKSFLATFLICAFMIVLLLARPRRSFLLWTFAGFVLGLLVLVRANTLVFVAAVIIWLAADNREGIPRKLMAALGFTVGVFLIVSSVCVRNYVVGNDIVLLTSQAGQNFFIGNNPWNFSGRYQPPIYIRPNPKYEQQDFRVRAEIVTGRKLKPSEASRFWFGEAFRFIREEPLRWLSLMWKKFWLFWNWYEVPDNQNFYFFSQYSLLLRLPLPDFRIVAALGLTGMIFALPTWRKSLLLYLVITFYSATVISFYVFDRYRLPVVPPLIVFAAFTVTTAATMAIRKNLAKFAGLLLLCAIFFGLLSTHVSPDEYYGDAANAYCRLGVVYQSEGKLPEALLAYRKSTEIMPYYWASYFGLGQVYERMGETGLALENYENARKYNPANPDICVRMGTIHYDKGALEKSAELFQTAAELNPDWSVPHYWLARIYGELGDEQQAALHVKKLKELASLHAPNG